MHKNIAGFLVVEALFLALGVGEAKAYGVQATDQRQCWDTSGNEIACEDNGVQATDQRQCWDTSGIEIACEDTGHDGEYQAGYGLQEFQYFEVYVKPKRFKEKGEVSIDRRTGLQWFKRQHCFQYYQTWNGALELVRNLNETGRPGNCAGEAIKRDYRLPNVRELLSILSYIEIDLDSETNPYWEVERMIEKPHYISFHDHSQSIWTSTTCPQMPDKAYVVDLVDGIVKCVSKSEADATTWLVRSSKAYEMMEGD